MPYISDKSARKQLDTIINKWWYRSPLTQTLKFTGVLNYFLFKLAKTICSNYTDYAAFLGELEAAKLEIYRRQIAPYEDQKIEENGDVN